MADQVTIPALQQMKREGKKSVGVVAWDYQIARIADRAGVDFVSVGDSVGVNLWGHANPLEVTLDEMLVCCKAVRRGVTRALVSCDVPFGPVQEGVDAALRAAIRLVKEGGADMLKLDGAADFPEAVRALVARRHSGVRPVRPHAADRPAIRHPLQRPGGRRARRRPPAMTEKLVEEAKMPGGRRRRAARFHQFRAGRGRRRGQGGDDPGDRRLRRRALARRPGADGAHRHRLWGEMDRLQDRHLRQRRQDQRSTPSRR